MKHFHEKSSEDSLLWGK